MKCLHFVWCTDRRRVSYFLSYEVLSSSDTACEEYQVILLDDPEILAEVQLNYIEENGYLITSSLASYLSFFSLRIFPICSLSCIYFPTSLFTTLLLLDLEIRFLGYYDPRHAEITFRRSEVTSSFYLQR